MEQSFSISKRFRIFLDLFLLSVCYVGINTYLHYKDPDLVQVFTLTDIKLLSLFLLLWYLSASICNLYDDFRSRLFTYELIPISKTFILYILGLTYIVFYFFRNLPLPRTFTSVYTLVTYIVIIMEKYTIRRILYVSRIQGKNVCKVLIIGASEIGINYYNTIAENKHFGYQLTGFLDNDNKKEITHCYLGKIDDLEAVLNNYDIDDIIIAVSENISAEKINKIITTGEEHAKRVRILPNYYGFGSGNFRINTFGNFPIVTIRSLPLDNIENKFFKQLLDILFSLTLTIFIFSWLFAIIAIIIKLTSKGPVFYIQERWGINGKRIKCYKFRSMHAKPNNEIDENGNFVPTQQNDPRVTRVGKFLRKHNLDELPQFINVLKGEMSIVGPRPHLSLENLEMKQVVKNYMLRHLVTPGITGWAQVHGLRGGTKNLGLMQQRIDMDLWYIENWTFWLDCQIIFQTVLNMLKGEKNAY